MQVQYGRYFTYVNVLVSNLKAEEQFKKKKKKKLENFDGKKGSKAASCPKNEKEISKTVFSFFKPSNKYFWVSPEFQGKFC